MEHWFSVPGFEGYYEASTLGRVRSVDRVIFVSAGGGHRSYYRRRTGRVLAGTPDGRGYHVVTLWVAHVGWHAPVHEVVAVTFHGPRPKGLYICHRNGVSANNTPRNLYYGTAKENVEDQRRHGTLSTGEKAWSAKLQATDVREIRRLKGRVPQPILCSRFGVSQSQISRIQNGHEWRHIGDEIAA